MTTTCESCQYAAEYRCSHDQMSGRPVYGLGRDHQRVYAESCENYTEIATETVPVEPKAPTRIEQTVVTSFSIKVFNDLSEGLRNDGWIADGFSTHIDGGELWYVQVFIRAV